MTDDTTNLLHFPRINPSKAGSPEIMELLAEITTLLRTADRLTQLTAKTGLEDERKLLVVSKLKDIVANTSSLYLVLLNDDEQARDIRSRIEGLIRTLDEA
ncbi:MAG: hypothetical protein O9296_17390 [Novosphingobium sp.]|nr:hypothetical protein [Novosphingobium sp.]